MIFHKFPIIVEDMTDLGYDIMIVVVKQGQPTDKPLVTTIFSNMEIEDGKDLMRMLTSENAEDHVEELPCSGSQSLN